MERRGSVDQFRGLTIILMVIVNYLADIRIVPGWLKHAPDVGLTFVDVIAPAFLLAIGLTYRGSFRRRTTRDGLPRAIAHFVRRWLALLGIGAIIAAGEGLTGATGRAPTWGVLQAIGTAGLLTLPLIGTATWARLVSACGLLGVYQAGFALGLGSSVISSSHGGLWGALGWTAALLLGTVIGDLQKRRIFFSVLVSAGFVAAGMLLGLFVPVSKNAVSASYVIVSMGISSLVYYGIFVPADRAGIKLSLLSWWGINPLSLYVLHYLLLAFLVLPGVDSWHAGATALLVVAQAGGILMIITLVAWLLHRRSIVISL